MKREAEALDALPIAKVKAPINSEERRRKFTSHAKFQNPGRQQQLTSFNHLEQRNMSAAKEGRGFLSIPNVIAPGTMMDSLKVNQQHSTTTNNS